MPNPFQYTKEGRPGAFAAVQPKVERPKMEGPARNPFRLRDFVHLLAKTMKQKEGINSIVTGDERKGFQIHVPLDRLKRMDAENALDRLARHRERLLETFQRHLLELERLNGTDIEAELFEHLKGTKDQEIRPTVGIGIRYVPANEVPGNINWMRPLLRTRSSKRRIQTP